MAIFEKPDREPATLAEFYYMVVKDARSFHRLMAALLFLDETGDTPLGPLDPPSLRAGSRARRRRRGRRLYRWISGGSFHPLRLG